MNISFVLPCESCCFKFICVVNHHFPRAFPSNAVYPSIRRLPEGHRYQEDGCLTFKSDKLFNDVEISI